MILHFCPESSWQAAVAAGEYSADTLVSQGFIHCSTPDQVAIPATALARGRQDILLLEIDEARLSKPVVWEQGDPPDPGGMLFPHVYEPIPVAAVVATHPYLPGPDGTFSRPSF
ncbi:DUF952 domain-containing protein [Actinoplanes friuliensis]|uniref:Glutathione S-transferase domain-containing protein n=1 Tax=Actinoplanes friuliensis DSM 7358 TaxID=1246995 RepID=U5WCD2_9ACTN|nr:DUF952 domain-containing protein [Actinoplanes friuliensis]AGZ45571.1 hypothetical protein AFR_36575 [Actinoplanes friuliensis DSM 7358]